MPQRISDPELPYRTASWDTADLLGHGDTARKLCNVDRFLEMEALDDTYHSIYAVLKQNLLIDEALDNEEDQQAPVPKNRRSRLPPPEGGAKKVSDKGEGACKKGCKRVTLHLLNWRRDDQTFRLDRPLDGPCPTLSRVCCQISAPCPQS